MKLGAFSISLSVQDLERSSKFYEDLGFNVYALISLFQGMFEGNILTFNPGWDENAKDLEEFTDVRDIQKHMKNKGHSLISEADENTAGPGRFMLTDPDGNMILLDQHR